MLYGQGCWEIMKKHAQKTSVAKMRIDELEYAKE